MKRTSRFAAGLAAICAAAMALAGCGASGDATSTDETDANIISYASMEPKSKLIPGNTNETPAAIVLRQIFSGLVSFDQDGNPVNEVAESIEPNDDASVYTIKLQDGWKFTDGTPVTAESFAKAWSYTANVSNAQIAASFFSSIKGYDELQKKGVDKDAQLSGVEVKDDKTLVVTLNSPNSTFKTMLGYTAYSPLPESFYKDPSAFGEKPVGNGPYKLDSWEHNKSIRISPNPDYKGPRKIKNDGIEYRVYTDPKASYADVQAGNLDISGVPASALKTFRTDKNVKAYTQPGSSIQILSIPGRLEHFAQGSEEGNLRRQAISMAIDRAEICDKIFSGTRTPSVDFIAPPIPGYSDSLEGKDVLDYNKAKAKELWKQADEISKWSGPLTITYAADQSGYKEATEAMVNSIKQTLGIEAAAQAEPTWSQFYDTVSDRTIMTPYLTGWSADYPAADNYLVQLYASSSADGKGANDVDYKNPDFDALMAKALASPTQEEASKYYQQGEALLYKDLPSMPLWNINASAVTAQNVKNVKFGYDNVVLLDQVSKQ